MRNYRTQCLAVCLTGLFMISASAFAEEAVSPGITPAANVKQKLFRLGFNGFLGSGLVAPPITPKFEGNAGMVPMESPYGIGVDMEYECSPTFRLFLDGVISSYRKLVAKKGGYGNGFWVYEQTGYTSHDVGPFPEDAYYFMDTSGFRVGGKYAWPGSISPWVGLGIGYYSWTAAFLTDDRSKSWGSQTGNATGITYLCGIDFKPAGNGVIFTLFFDGASPVANPIFKDLFGNGWTWENVSGSHVMPPYRFGAMLSMPM